MAVPSGCSGEMGTVGTVVGLARGEGPCDGIDCGLKMGIGLDAQTDSIGQVADKQLQTLLLGENSTQALPPPRPRVARVGSQCNTEDPACNSSVTSPHHKALTAISRQSSSSLPLSAP